MKNKILDSEVFYILEKLDKLNNTIETTSQRVEAQLNNVVSQLFYLNQTLNEGFEDAVIKIINQDRNKLIKEVADEIQKRSS